MSSRLPIRTRAIVLASSEKRIETKRKRKAVNGSAWTSSEIAYKCAIVTAETAAATTQLRFYMVHRMVEMRALHSYQYIYIEIYIDWSTIGAILFLSVSRLMIGNNNAILVLCEHGVVANECSGLFHAVDVDVCCRCARECLLLLIFPRKPRASYYSSKRAENNAEKSVWHGNQFSGV